MAVAADTEAAFAALAHAAGAARGAVLAADWRQPLPWRLRERIDGAPDALLAAPTATSPADRYEAELIADPDELLDFFRRQGLRFLSPAMLSSGGCHGIRGSAGELICAGALNFVLERHRYAHLGPVATHPAHRRQGHARAVVTALRGHLAGQGVERCGLFAERGQASLCAYYAALGFEMRSRYHFIPVG